MGDCLEYTPTKKITQKKNNKNLQESFLKPIMEETQPGRFKTNFDVAI